MSALSDKLAAALNARERRLARRRLPEPPSATHPVVDFTSNDYLSLSTSLALRKAVLSALSASPQILGSGGSRLLVPCQPHAELEARLCRFFSADAALLFNSGFDANVGFFSAVPQAGDIVLYDAHVHASVHDGMRLSRVKPDSMFAFAHNSVRNLQMALSRVIGDREELKEGKASAFIVVESLYSMDGTIAPLTQIVECVEEMLPLGNGYIVVDEAHATGIYGPKGRGLVVDTGLEKRVFARLHTFGKALASSGAVLLVTDLVKDYLLNYARSLVFTTSLTFANVVAINCSFDMLENGTTEALSKHLLDLSTYFVHLLRSELKKFPSSLLSLPDYLVPAISNQPRESPPRQLMPCEIDPRDKQSQRNKASSTRSSAPRNKMEPSGSPPSYPTPIIPVLTPEPRALSSFLLSYAVSSSSGSSTVLLDSPSSSSSSSSPLPPPSNTPSTSSTPTAGVVLHTKPIYPPTVPKGTSRVRICLHAGHTRENVTLLARGIVAWAEKRMAEERQRTARWQGCAEDVGVEAWMEAKL